MDIATAQRELGVPDKIVKYKIICSLLTLIALAGCKSVSTDIKESQHDIRKFESSKATYLNIQFYDLYNKTDSIPTFMKVNGIYFEANYEKYHRVLKVDSGDFDIMGYYIGKEHAIFNGLKVSKGDSTVIKLYMRDNTSPSH